MTAKLADIVRVLKQGGSVRYTWRTGRADLVGPDGTVWRIDGRSYQGMLSRESTWLDKETMGSIDAKDLVITWRAKGQPRSVS